MVVTLERARRPVFCAELGLLLQCLALQNAKTALLEPTPMLLGLLRARLALQETTPLKQEHPGAAPALLALTCQQRALSNAVPALPESMFRDLGQHRVIFVLLALTLSALPLRALPAAQGRSLLRRRQLAKTTVPAAQAEPLRQQPAPQAALLVLLANTMVVTNHALHVRLEAIQPVSGPLIH